MTACELLDQFSNFEGVVDVWLQVCPLMTVQWREPVGLLGYMIDQDHLLARFVVAMVLNWCKLLESYKFLQIHATPVTLIHVERVGLLVDTNLLSILRPHNIKDLGHFYVKLVLGCLNFHSFYWLLDHRLHLVSVTKRVFSLQT